MSSETLTLCRECQLCLGWGLQASQTFYLEWEKQLGEIARQFHRFGNKNAARLFEIKMRTLQLLLNLCFHCDGTGLSTVKTISLAG